MMDWLVEAAQWIWAWILDIVKAAADIALNGLFSAVPTFDHSGLQAVADILYIGNKWVPIDVLILGLAAHWTFLALFVGVKFVLKLIPGIG